MDQLVDQLEQAMALLSTGQQDLMNRMAKLSEKLTTCHDRPEITQFEEFSWSLRLR